MFENDVNLLREHIEYLKRYLASELDEMPSADELESSIVEFRNDIDTVRGSLPYDEIDEDDIPIEDFSGENLEDGELEDELVEAETIIQELEELILEAESSEEGRDSIITDGEKEILQSDIPFWDRMIDWIKKAYSEKCESQGRGVPSEEELNRIAACFICSAKKRGHFSQSEEYASEHYPDFHLTADEIQSTSLQSSGIDHITQEAIHMYELLGARTDFEGVIRFYGEIWGDLI